jgi:2-polyprenyl-6-methoxyphenol hydroxylase-like FAD-dependent oxidoreductase
MPRHAEIAGAGFGGLVAAIALAERGWSVRVHEKTPLLRAEGFAIALQPNMLKVLESIGVLAPVLQGGLRIIRRETRDQHDRPTMVITGGGGNRTSRQHITTVLAARAEALGVVIEYDSPAASAEPEGTLVMADRRRLRADLVIGADGVNSMVRDSLGLLRTRRLHVDGAMRMMVPRLPAERAEDARLGPMTCETWSGTRRVITSPASEGELYVAMSCLAADSAARATPLEVAAWSGSFPHLAPLFRRVRDEAEWPRVKWVQFQTLKLRRWRAGRVAILGDAACAMPPNLGQGAGCAMMNALALAVHLEREPDIEAALAAWEASERALTEHTQRWSSVYGSFTTWPGALRSLAFRAMGGIPWLRRQYRRTALHVPTGYRPASDH